MARKPKDEIERLEEQIRELKSANRTLTKKLKKIDRGYYKLRDYKSLEEDEELKVHPDDDKDCFDCKGGKLKLVLIANRRFRICNVCQKRTRVKIV